MITNYLNGAGSALAVGEVSQELGDAILAEGAGQRRILHLLVAEHGHGRVAEAANVHRLGSSSITLKNHARVKLKSVHSLSAKIWPKKPKNNLD